jgi:hypothetical protein
MLLSIWTSQGSTKGPGYLHAQGKGKYSEKMVFLIHAAKYYEAIPRKWHEESLQPELMAGLSS